MKISEVSKEMLSSITTNFEDLDFFFDLKNRSFVRHQKNGTTNIFTLLFYRKKDRVEIEPIIRINVDAIEEVYLEVAGVSEIFSTIGSDLFSIVKYYDEGIETGVSKGQLWVVRDEKDIQKLKKVIPIYFEREILKYFNENSSVRRVDELLNKYPREISIHNWLYPLRANLAIIAAKLNKNPKYNELVAIYEEELEEAEETYKAEFNQLKEVLKKY